MRIEGPSRLAFKDFESSLNIYLSFFSAIIIRYLTIYLFVYSVYLMGYIVNPLYELFNPFLIFYGIGTGKTDLSGLVIIRLIYHSFLLDFTFCSLSSPG